MLPLYSSFSLHLAKILPYLARGAQNTPDDAAVCFLVTSSWQSIYSRVSSWDGDFIYLKKQGVRLVIGLYRIYPKVRRSLAEVELILVHGQLLTMSNFSGRVVYMHVQRDKSVLLQSQSQRLKTSLRRSRIRRK